VDIGVDCPFAIIPPREASHESNLQLLCRITIIQTQRSLHCLCITTLAGLVGEALAYQKVLPGTVTSNLLQLKQGIFCQLADFLRANQQQDLTHWGALMASLLLHTNMAA